MHPGEKKICSSSAPREREGGREGERERGGGGDKFLQWTVT